MRFVFVLLFRCFTGGEQGFVQKRRVGIFLNRYFTTRRLRAFHEFRTASNGSSRCLGSR